MTKDVIELAREAGLVPDSPFVGVREWQSTALTKFATLVAARERERCALVALNEPRVWDLDAPDPQHRIAAAIRALNTEGEGNDRQPASN